MPEINVRLNLACGGRHLGGYLNVDIETLKQLKDRYPVQHFADSLQIVQYNLFNLQFEDESVDKIRADGLIKYLPFIDEPRFFYHVKRVLKGELCFKFQR